jgi:5-methylcytosine-specific restriction endonuclease McrA
MDYNMRNPKYPFSPEEFYNPQLAIERYGLAETLDMYETIEYRYVHDAPYGYPKDWAWRKLAANQYRRCRSCGKRLGNFEGQTHHIIHRGHGGDHSLGNLETLCRSCHEKEHPEKQR